MQFSMFLAYYGASELPRLHGGGVEESSHSDAPSDMGYGTTFSSELLNSICSFFVQFTGDIHQPLHVENLEVGGNGIAVLFNNKTTNLHAAVSLTLRVAFLH